MHILPLVYSQDFEFSLPPPVMDGRFCSCFPCCFNKYFYSIFIPSWFDLTPLDSLPTLSLTLFDISISTSEVFKSLVSLDPTKALGIDCLGPQIFNHFFISFASAFLLIPFLRNGEFIELATLIHKYGDHFLVSNYRPISLPCSISKVLGQIIYNHVLGVISFSISPSQFGFLRNRSVAQQLLTFLNCVHESLQSKIQFDVI